ncbi:hypothetical protein BDW60DRAFT_205303 [Aspergillus nidulans var. acristatus]
MSRLRFSNIGCLMLFSTLRWQPDRYLRHRPPPSMAMAGELDEPPADIQTMLDDFHLRPFERGSSSSSSSSPSSSFFFFYDGNNDDDEEARLMY